MKNIKFESNDLKKEFKYVLNSHPALYNVLYHEFRLDSNVIKILDIDSKLYGMNILVNDSDVEIVVTIDFLNKKIKIQNPNIPYKKIYSDCKQEYPRPECYVYHKGERRVFREHVTQYKKNHQENYYLTIVDNGKVYHTIFENGKEEFDIDILINYLLDYDKNIDSIQKLLAILKEHIDLTNFDIKLSDNNGDLIKITYGSLEDYLEYRDLENEKQKIFLKNGEFFIERRIKEKCDDETISFVKKMGVYNGKEKRKN